jgi:hypothetical protein
MSKPKYTVSGLFALVEEDTYLEGCTGNHHTKDVDVNFKDDTLEGLLKSVCDFCNSNSYTILDDGEFQVTVMEDSEGLPATKPQIKAWKQAEIKLFCVSYNARIELVTAYEWPKGLSYSEVSITGAEIVAY